MLGFISQPRYLPSLSYLERIALSDIFVCLDDVLVSKRKQFENRNHFRGKMVSIPIIGRESESARPMIKDAKIADTGWVNSHKSYMVQSAITTPLYKDFLPYLDLYFRSFDVTSDVYVDAVVGTMKCIFDTLGFSKVISFDMSSDYGVTSLKTDKLYSLCVKSGIKTLLSGGGMEEYGVSSVFKELSNQDNYTDVTTLVEYKIPKGYEGFRDDHVHSSFLEILCYYDVEYLKSYFNALRQANDLKPLYAVAGVVVCLTQEALNEFGVFSHTDRYRIEKIGEERCCLVNVETSDRIYVAEKYVTVVSF